LALLEGEEVKFSSESLRAKLAVASPAPPVHHAQPVSVSITWATEVGCSIPPMSSPRSARSAATTG